MNKIFKVVWSKTKECYVVVSEVAKNNGGKKKVLASVLAGLAMVGAGAAGTPVQAGGNYGNSAVNIAPDNLAGSNYANAVSKNSVVVGYQNDSTGGPNNESGKIIYGANNTANRESSLAVGNENKVYAKSGTALGVGNTVAASAEASVAIGNRSKANADRTIAIGSGAEANGQQTIALGRTAKSAGTNDIVIGTSAETQGNGDSIAIGRDSSSNKDNTITIGAQSKATGSYAVALGRESEVSANFANAMGYKSKAKASGALALGSNTIANGTSATAVGTGAKVGDDTNAYEGGVAVGRNASAQAEHAAAVGNGAVATGKSSIASGDGANASAENAAAYGAGAEATNKQATAVGNLSKASGESASAFGYNNIVTGDNSTALGTGNVIDKRTGAATVAGAVAVGNQNKASGDRAIAIGETNTSKVEDTITMGTSNTASIGGGIAIGKGNTADSTIGGGSANGNSQVAIGADNRAVDEDTIAIGRENNATERLAMAIGNRTEATGVGSVAIGSNGAPDGTGLVPKTISSGTFSVALGAQTKSTGTASVAVGGKSQATANSATAVGREANASAESATAVGYKATASIKDGVALGSQSKATIDKGVKGFNPAEDRTKQYTALAGNVQTSTLAAVSVGDGVNATRQITGLAAGKENTDAVNVAQLRSVNLKYAGDTGNGDVLLDNGTLTVKGEGLLSTSADTDGITLKLKEGGLITDTNGKVTAPTPNGAATTDNVAQAINRSGWNATASANGGTLSGTVKVQKVSPGDTVTFSSGTNLVVEQSKAGNQFTYSLNKDVDLTKDGSLTIGDTKINNAGMTITGGPSITKTGIDAGSKKITNVTAGTADTDAVNVKQLKDTEKHIKPGTYAVANDGSVTLKYVDGNGTEQTETAKITGIAKKSKVINGQNTTVEEGTDTTDNSVTYKVNVKGDLADISSITNGTGSGKISFEGDQVVKVGGDHPISFDGKGGYVTGLQNKDWDITNPTVVSGRAATEDQLKKVSDGFNNTVKLTGNSGATGTQKLNQNGGLSFGVVGADNGKYITTTASGSNVVADLSTDAKNKLNSKVVVAGSGAATVGTPTVTTNPDGSTVTTYTVHVDPATATAASTESVVKKAVTGDTNIADVSVADGKATGDVGAKYEVSVSRNAVKDAAREAVTINNGGTKSGTTYTPNADNPITVTPKEDAANHNTTYEVTFDGNKAAKQIPLTYKATNDGTTTADQTVKLDKGLNFTGGNYTTASVGADGKVTFDVKLGTAPTVTDGKPGVPGQAGAAGKDGIATVKTVVDTINNSGWKANAKANGGNLDGSATATVVKPGNTVNYAAGKNITVKQELETDASNALTGNQTYTYSLNKDIDLTNAGSLTVGDTTVNNGGITIKAPTPAAGTTATTTDVKLTNTGLDNGGNKIVNVAEGKADTDAVNVKQLKDAKTVLVDGKNTTKSGTGTAADPYKVNVEGDLTGISSITNDGTNNGKISFGPNKTVTVDGDHSITLNASTGKIGGLQNKTFDPTNFTSGQAATEDQLKSVHDTLKASELHIAPTAGTTNNVAEYTVDANNKVTLTYQDGNGTAATAPKAVIDLSALANKITSGYTFNTNAIAKGGAVDGSASVKAVDNGGTINYAAGKNLTVKQEIDTTNKTQTYTYSLDKDINVETVTVTGQNGKDGKIGINGKDGVTRTISVEVPGQTGQPGTPGVDGTTTTRIVFDDKAQANLDDGLKFTGNNESTENKHKLNTLVKVQGEGTKEGTNAAGTKEIQTSDGTKFESAKDNIAVEANNGDTLTVKLNKKLKGLDSVQTKTVELGDHTTPGGTTNITYNSGDKRIEYTTPGATAGTTETKKVATTDDIWTIQGNGTDVKPVNGKVNVKAGDNVVIKTPTTADGSMTISAVTSAVYTKADGTKVYKIIDPTTGAVTWNTKADGTGTPVIASDVIVSFQDADGNTTGGGSIVNNVGSAIDKTGTSTGNAFLTKLDTAANATPNAAVNVKDLKNTSDALINKGLNFTGNNDATVNAHKLGSLVKVQGEGVTAAQVAGFQSAEGNIAVVANSTDTLEIKLNKNLKGINSVSNGSSSITLNSNPGGTNNTPAVQITGGNLSMGDGTTNGNNKIVNLAPGTDDNDAVNVKQLKTAKTVVEAGTNVTVHKTTGANGEDVYTVSATGGGTGTASSWNVKSTGNTDPTSETAAKNISDGKTVEMAAGKNLTVKQTSDANGAKVEFALNKDLSNLDKVVVNGKDGIAGKDGVTIIGPQGATGATGMPGTNGIDGKVGISGKDGKDAVSISGKDGVGTIGLTGPQGPAGADGKGVDISTDHGTQTLVKPEANNGNKSERIVYVPKDKDGNPLKDTDGNTIKREVATMDDGLKFAGDDGQANQDTNPNVIKKQLNNVVDIIGGADKNKLTENNIGVNNDNGKLKVQLSKEIDLTPSGKLKIGDTTVNTGGLTITGGPSVKKDGIDAGDKKITNVANGDVNATSKDAVNGSQLYQAMQDAKTHLDHGQNTTVSGTGTQADPYKVNVQGDLNKISSITNNAGDGKVKFDPNQTVTVAGDHNISLNGKTGDITGLTNTSIGGADFATKGRAATEEQLKEAMNSSVEKVKKAADSANDKNIAEVNPTGGATNYGKAGTTYEVSVSRNAVESNARLSYTDNGNPSKKVTLSEGLNFKNGTNTTARTEPNGQVFYDVNPNLQNISSISGSTTGNGPRISFNNAGANSTVNIDGGNLNMNNKKITNVANGSDPHDAVNVSQLKSAKTIVEAADSSVTVTKDAGAGANGEDIYKIKANPAGTVDLTNVNNRVDQLGEEIGRVGAQGAALSALKPIQYDPLEPTQIMAGYGNYRGNSAVALGVAHYKNESTLIHGGVSWAGGSSHMMANAGVTWKVGNRDSEAAVADRYRKGPISSAYAMQQEMASMKAQNAGLKGEVSDLKAENEQMKAQIAAMMAKLGL